MTTILISCLVVDDYSNENVLDFKVYENETVGNFVETIKKSNIGFDNTDGLKFLKSDLPSDKLSDKLAFLETNPSANIKKTLGGEELLAIETTILESFVTGKNYIIIVPPPPHFTFKKCIDEKKLVPGDKIIYQYSNGYLEGEIVNKLQIRCIKDREEYFLDSFSKFIKLAISPSDIKSNNWRNLWIELCDSKEKLIWRDFRHRMLNESNDITNRKRMLKLESVAESSRQTEGENSIEDDTKSKEITLPKKMEEKRDSNNIAYNRIHLGNPIVSIKSSDNTKHIVASDFFSVNATLSRGSSAITHNEVEHLYNKLVSKKDAIDCILKSQPVYAIGPIFHENNTFPFIACWGEKPLSQPILEDLEKLFDYEFKAVSHQIIELVHCRNELLNNSGASGGSRGSQKDNHNRSRGDSSSGRGDGDDLGKGDGSSNDGGRGDGDDLGKGDGSSNDGGRGDGDDGSSNDGSRDDSDDPGRGGRDDDGVGNAGNKKVIMVSSVASAKTEDCNNKQQFVINLNLHAKINESSEIPKFSIDIDVFQCETDVMLSEIWKALSNEGHGYSLESVKIIISPINDDPDYESGLVTREYSYPREKKGPIERSENIEKAGNVEIGAVSKFAFQMKSSRSTKIVSDEWELKTRGGSNATLINWLYKKNLDDTKLYFAPGLHKCRGSIISKHLCGFRITVIQVFKFVVYRNILSTFGKGKPKLIMCPQISHNLEITFNNLKDFNEKFDQLGSLHQEDKKIAFTVNNIPNESVNKNSGIIDIKRSVIQDNQDGIHGHD